MRFWTTFGRSCRLRCPRCGVGRLFLGWFQMVLACSGCGFRFQREAGYFLGSIYFNYGLTALVVTVAYFALYFGTTTPPNVIWGLLTAFCFLFPLWFFRYARSLWLGFDVYFDPPESDRPWR
jgi:uncharacterized protein (DUF983 family)